MRKSFLFRAVICSLLLTLILMGCLPALSTTNGQIVTQPTVAPLIVTISQVPSPTEIILPPTATPTAVPTSTPSPSPTLEPIVIPIVIYILDDDENGLRSSRRQETEIESIFVKVNQIWWPAGIRLDLIGVERVNVPQAQLENIANRNFPLFYDSINRREIRLTRFAPIIGFYVRDLGGPNGINPLGSNTFFVMDTPSVLDERVTSHEIGHILGLHHVLDDPNRLMFSGTNGKNLSEAEIVVARYAAEGLLVGVR